MESYRERLIELLRKEIELLNDFEFPVENLFERKIYFVDQSSRDLKELKGKVDSLSRQIDEISSSRGTCPLSNGSDDGEGAMQLLTGLTKKSKRERKYLDRQIHGAESLTIADPYFFSWTNPNKVFKKEREYTDFIIKLVPHTVKELEVFHLPGPNKRIFQKFDKMMKSRKIKSRYIETTEIHDRVFIKDSSEATLVGTSLGGYGNKLAFVLPLPEDDLHTFSEELDRIRNA